MCDRIPKKTAFATLTLLATAATGARADIQFGGPRPQETPPIVHTVQENFTANPKPVSSGGTGSAGEPRLPLGETFWTDAGGGMLLPTIRFVDLPGAFDFNLTDVDQGAAPVYGLIGGGGGATIPAPGALSLIGLAALLAHRRRRN